MDIFTRHRSFRIGMRLTTCLAILSGCLSACLSGCQSRTSQPTSSAKQSNDSKRHAGDESKTSDQAVVSDVETASETATARHAGPDAPAVPTVAEVIEVPTAQAAVSVPPAPTQTSQPESWTTQRVVVMGRGGPRFLKLDVNVGHQDLATGFEATIASLASEMQLNFQEPVEWNAMLDHPLIASGWLGNLVPTSEQREQLRGLYDNNNNSKVEEPEFRAFITRGLSRSAHLKLASRPQSALRLPAQSIWGPIDRDRNGELDADEQAQASETMLRFDFDGDYIVTQAELRSITENDPMAAGATQSSLLDMKPVHAWDIAKPESMVRAVFDHYSFSDMLTSELLYAWPGERLKRIDVSGDSSLNAKELAAVSDSELDGVFQVRLPDVIQSASAEMPSVNFQSITMAEGANWSSHPSGGRLTLDGCIVTIAMRDEQNAALRKQFEQQLRSTGADGQFQALALQVLELKEGAMGTLQRLADEQHVDTGELAWRWLVAPRHWQVQIGWSGNDSPWFELMDLNGDQRLVKAELHQFAQQAQRWDRNKDGVIQSEEMPVSILLDITRADSRGLSSRLGGMGIEKRGTNGVSAPTWFTGMDYNSDGELTPNEFFGEPSDFEKFDRDRNGIIEAREVTTPQ